LEVRAFAFSTNRTEVSILPCTSHHLGSA
jgi:hypothetical protein